MSDGRAARASVLEQHRLLLVGGERYPSALGTRGQREAALLHWVISYLRMCTDGRDDEELTAILRGVLAGLDAVRIIEDDQ